MIRAAVHPRYFHEIGSARLMKKVFLDQGGYAVAGVISKSKGL